MCIPSPVIPVVEVETVPLSITPLPPPESTPFSCEDDPLILEQWVTTALSARLQVLAAHDSAFSGRPDEIIDELETIFKQYQLMLQAGTPACAETSDQSMRNVLWRSLGMLQSFGNNVDSDYVTMRGDIERELNSLIEDILYVFSAQ